MVSQKDRYIGNILFYDYLLAQRTPIFLNRNLTKVLRIHQQELGRSFQVIDHNSSKRRSLWRPISGETLYEMIEKEKASEAFVVDIKGIEPLEPAKRSWERPARKKGPLFRLNIDVHITILEPTSGDLIQQISNTRVTLLGVHSDHGKSVSLAMSKSAITLGDILQSRGIGGEPSWRKSPPKRWNLMISIQFRDTKDAEDFYSEMAAPDSPLRKEPPTRLVMQWSNILECPDAEMVLPLATATGGHRGQHLELGLRINMYWRTTKSESILAAYNRQLQCPGRRISSDLTPPPLEPPNPSHHQFELTFVYPDEVLTRRGLVCPHERCKRSFSLVDDLRMHLLQWHDMFRYTVRKEKEVGNTQHWRFQCEVADHKADQQRASNAAPEPYDVRVVAPKRPFNQQKFLEHGDDDWQRTARLEKTRRPQLQQRTSSNTPVVRVRPKPKSPDEVTQIVQGEKNIYKVPKAPPDVTFFRSVSKRPLQEGEYISESDDEVDMTWVALKKDAQIDNDTSMSEPNKRFLKVYDPFIRDERLQNDVHVGDTIVRFARAKAAFLWQEDIVKEFQVKVDELVADKIVSQETCSAVLKIVDSSKPQPQPQEQLSGRLASLDTRMPKSTGDRERAKGRAKVTDTGHITPQTADSDGDVEMRDAQLSTSDSHNTDSASGTPPYDQCLCGEDALSSRDRAVVFCDRINCIRNAFHTDCVVQQWKHSEPSTRNWVCRECEADAAGVPQHVA